MQTVSDLDELSAKIDAANDILTRDGDAALRAFTQTFRGDFAQQAPPDPFSPEYRAFQLAIHERITGKRYSTAMERTHFDVATLRDRPFPFYLQHAPTAGEHLLAIGAMLRHMDLAPGARIIEFGPGWGNTTIALALLGFRVTAIDIEPNFLDVLRHRAAQHGVTLDLVEAGFFHAETVSEPYDAALFFESFHHCDDHLRLLRALRNVVKPDGLIVFGAEPIVHDHPIPWGVSMHGIALWSMRNFGWLELGFSEDYFRLALARTGWKAEQRRCLDLPWASTWIARRAEPMLEPEPLPDYPARITELERDLAAIRGSTSWRITGPLRRLRRLLP